MRVLGIDGGLAGALAVVEDHGPHNIELLGVIDVPVIGDGAQRVPDALAVMEFIRQYSPRRAFVERAQAMPSKGRHGADPEEEWKGQGASSALIYGRAVGYLECCCVGLLIPMKRVEARSWKAANGLIKVPGTKPTSAETKERSRQKALQFFAGSDRFERKKDHNRAEAALIARYGAFLLRGTYERPALDRGAVEGVAAESEAGRD